MRRVLESIYYASAMLMPLWFGWQWQYVMNARVYFECQAQDDFIGWPWKYKLARFTP